MNNQTNWVEVKPPKLKRDWKGCTVRTVCDITNHFFMIPAGTLMTITWQSQRGSELTAARCNCCGVQSSVSHVKPKSFVFVAPAEADHE